MALKGTAGRAWTALRGCRGGNRGVGLAKAFALCPVSNFPSSFLVSQLVSQTVHQLRVPLWYKDYLTQPRGERNTARHLFIGGGRGPRLS